MLKRIDHDNGVVTLQPRWADTDTPASVIGAFTTRVGGVSEPPFDTLNLGSLTKSPPEDVASKKADHNMHVSENYRRVRASLRLERLPRIVARQCHGEQVYRVEQMPSASALRQPPEADAIVTDQPGLMLTIRTADCVPVLLCSTDPHHPAIGAVHAGWRGTLAGVVTQTVLRMRDRLGVEPARLVAAIGPCIHLPHYEVGSKLAAAFGEAGLSHCVHEADSPLGVQFGFEKAHLDLVAAVQSRLEQAGVSRESIALPVDADAPHESYCTYERSELFFSYRRDVSHGGAPAVGHMAALIALR